MVKSTVNYNNSNNESETKHLISKQLGWWCDSLFWYQSVTRKLTDKQKIRHSSKLTKQHVKLILTMLYKNPSTYKLSVAFIQSMVNKNGMK